MDETIWKPQFADRLVDGSVRIPEEKVATLNRTVDLGGGKTLQHFEDEKGGYRAMIEVFH